MSLHFHNSYLQIGLWQENWVTVSSHLAAQHTNLVIGNPDLNHAGNPSIHEVSEPTAKERNCCPAFWSGDKVPENGAGG